MSSDCTCVVRPALTEDAAAAVAVLRASITALCTDDHRNDPTTLTPWLENKTSERFLEWLANTENCLVVAEVEAELCGVGLLAKSGSIRLCYVKPGRQRLGVGRALLRALEARARAWQLDPIRLESSVAARSFYEHAGYRVDGEPSVAFGVVTSFPYVKVLRADKS